MTDPKSTTFALRLPMDLLARIDAITQAEATRTGYPIKRPDWIRLALQRAVAEHEAAHPTAGQQGGTV